VGGAGGQRPVAAGYFKSLLLIPHDARRPAGRLQRALRKRRHT